MVSQVSKIVDGHDRLTKKLKEAESRNAELVEALEKAQAGERRWHRVASRVHEQACDSDVKIDGLESIRAAAEKLVRCKGRYHSELNYRALAALFGVTTPDLPPLENENVHYADAAEMEITALRQRIAELESRTVTVKLPTTRLWAGVTECYEKPDVIAAIRSAGMEVSDD
ncbi:ead/Ea22-like family protein [Klebsiella oxytoca]|uniref:ead/Ea22-like family protein n=1 Tax=Klebsiella oxytoca TaxID=571 RepID=UPI0034D2B013